ncbi:MAG: hypothetical protein C0504_20020 [Candidatus Solibacter sp.]|nr:hypothetical protein [Candidatus Solibacter sp.]
MKLGSALLACSLLLAPAATAYHHFITYSATYQRLVARFDPAALPGKKLPILIRETGAQEYAPGDSFTSLVSQVRAAANAWNQVSASELKLTFGGLSSESRPIASPHVEIVFDEMPPGIIAMGGPTNRLDPVTDAYGAYVPIVRSQVILPINLASPTARPVYTERFFLTLVHEIGHALGLQHSWSGGVMSTEITRTTSKASPLTLDDQIGMSILYPSAAFRGNTVAIAGRVVLGAAGIHLASVTAITPAGPAVSVLTGLDGSYRIEGLAPGPYYLYAQPLPPALQGEPQPVNLTFAADPANPDNLLLPGPGFNTSFYPGDTSTPHIPIIFPKPGEFTGYDFSVRARDKVNLHSVQTYTFIGQEAVKPASMVVSSGISSLILYGYGMTTGAAPMPGLGVSLLDAPESIAPGGIKAYPYASSYVQLDVQKSASAALGHRHLIFTLNGETHVAPSSLRILKQQAPTITALTPNPDNTLTIEGGTFAETSKVLFDGVAGTVAAFDPQRLVVKPPVAPFGHRSVVAVLNPDGQSTLMPLGSKSPAYGFETAAEPSVRLATPSMPAGAEGLIEIAAEGVEMDSGALHATFGSGEITALNLIPVSPSKALVHVAVSPSAAVGAVPVSLWAGLKRITAAEQFNIMPANSTPYVVMSKISGGTPYPGGELIVPVGKLPESASPAGSSAIIAGVPAMVTRIDAESGLVHIVVPAAVPPGKAVLRLSFSGIAALPAMVTIESAPPMIHKVQTIMGADLTGANAPKPGELIQVLARNLPDLGATPDVRRFLAGSGPVEHSIISVAPVAGQAGEYAIAIALSPLTAAGPDVALSIVFDSKLIGTVKISVR